MNPWWQSIARVQHVEIFHVDLSPNSARERCARDWLDPNELLRFHRIQTEESKRQFVLCRSALRACLIELLDCKNESLQFTDSLKAKPVAILDGEQTSHEFNVSHSYRHALLAFSDKGRVGIDVEERIVRHDIDGEISKAFSAIERKALHSTSGEDKVQMFFRLWTIKESLIKATGRGFRCDTSSFTIPTHLIHGARRAHFQFPHASKDKWLIENLENDDFAAALTLETD